MVRYVTLAYGDAPGVYRQSLMLLLSLVAHAPEPYELVVATDRPECYVWFGTRVEIEYLDFARLTAWRGPRPFSMRQKLELARAATPSPESGLSRVPPAATVLLDADVLAREAARPVRRAPHGRRAVHAQEGIRARREPPHAATAQLWASLRQSPDVRVQGGRRDVELGGAGGPHHRPRRCWTSRSRSTTGSAPRACATSRPSSSSKGVILGRTGRLHAAEEWFAHYWGNKPGYDAEIARRLADAFIEGLTVKEAAARLPREAPIDLPVEVRRSRAEKLAIWLQKRQG